MSCATGGIYVSLTPATCGIYVSLTPATCAKKSVLVGWKVEFFRQLLYTFNYINVFDAVGTPAPPRSMHILVVYYE